MQGGQDKPVPFPHPPRPHHHRQYGGRQSSTSGASNGWGPASALDLSEHHRLVLRAPPGPGPASALDLSTPRRLVLRAPPDPGVWFAGLAPYPDTNAGAFPYPPPGDAPRRSSPLRPLGQPSRSVEDKPVPFPHPPRPHHHRQHGGGQSSTSGASTGWGPASALDLSGHHRLVLRAPPGPGPTGALDLSTPRRLVLRAPPDPGV
ncbi:PREDICTED: transcription initiation factor TFIID subunit 4-like [Papilio xuthus]|uniref:Transcription initiation factor TFIID subunit 4-like n=1 Tax=Papilio xuthus TaxID=66420 RepID=A0AAJ6Z324_PAPXU|nr:PREDICTED: transcription initiation factor TFIID subunit 4-like [Papilio xuthus]